MQAFIHYLTAPAFEHILSIGYEYEAHNLTKLVVKFDGKSYYSANKHLREANEAQVETVDGVKIYEHKNYSEFLCRQKRNIDFCVYTDNAPDDIHPPIKQACRKVPMQTKNNYWHLKKTNSYTASNTDKRLIKFRDHDCDYFPDVEWIVTFYKPPKQNLVLKTMKKSLKLIIDSLLSYKKERVNLYAKKRVVLKTVLLDDTLLILNLEDPFSVVPQLTFTCHIQNCVAVISKFAIKGTIGYEEIKKSITVVNKLKLNVAASNYLFLIMYMSLMHFKYKSAAKKTYYKYFMTFLPRHEFSVLVDKFRSACTAPELEAFSKAASHHAVTSEFGAEYADFLFGAVQENKDVLNIDRDMVSTLFEAKDDVVYIEFRGLAQCIKYFLGQDTNRIGVVKLYNALIQSTKHTRKAPTDL
jgi:hypothetical protein